MARAQQTSNLAKAQLGGIAIASEFGQWQALARGPVGPPGGTATVLNHGFTLPDGTAFVPFAVGDPVKISGDQHPETVTVTAVSCSTGSTQCSFAANFTFDHNSTFTISSGTEGLQEAINYEAANGGGVVAADPAWEGSMAAVLSSLHLPSSVLLIDETAGHWDFYGLGKGGAPIRMASFSSATGVGGIPGISGAITAGDCALWATTTSLGDAGPCGSGGGGMVNPMTAAGDLIVGGSSGAPGRLAAGTSGYVLTSTGPGSAPSWQVATGGAGAGVSSLQVDEGTALTGNVMVATGSGLSSSQLGQTVTMGCNAASPSLAGCLTLAGDLGGSATAPQVTGVEVSLANDTSTGTVVNELARITATGLLAASTGDTTGAIGVVVNGAGTSGNAAVAVGGVALCQFDGTAVTEGDWVQISATVAGNCHDAGASKPASGEIVGIAAASGAAGTKQNVYLAINF